MRKADAVSGFLLLVLVGGIGLLAGPAAAVAPCAEGYAPAPGGVCVRPPAPPTCPAGTTQVAGSCTVQPTCPPGTTFVGGACRMNAPASCPAGATLVSGPVPACNYPTKNLVCPAGFNRVPVPVPPFVDCIGDPWMEIAPANPLPCPPWPAYFAPDRGGQGDKCVAPSPFGDVVTDVLCPPPVPGGKVTKKVQPGRDICRMFMLNPAPPKVPPTMQP